MVKTVFPILHAATIVQKCLCLTLFRVWNAPKFVRTLKIPYISVVKEYASQPVVLSQKNTAYVRLNHPSDK